MLCSPNYTFRTACSREPYIWVRFLHGYNPGVNDSIIIVVSFISKWAGLSPTLNYEVMGLFESSSIFSRIDACLQGFYSSSSHKTRYYSTARVAIEHSNFFGHPNWVINGDYITQYSYLNFLGQLRNYSSIQVHRGLHTPIRCVMFIAHNPVKIDLVR